MFIPQNYELNHYFLAHFLSPLPFVIILSLSISHISRIFYTEMKVSYEQVSLVDFNICFLL